MTPIPDWLTSTLASDATGGVGALAPWVRALNPGGVVVGRALVVGLGRDDNSPMRDAAKAVAEPDTILVVAGATESRTAVLGDLVARELLAAAIAAVVTDGLVRDADAVADCGLRVWARGTTSVASRKEGIGYVGGVVPIAGVVVRDGDLIIADGDGVVAWPAASVEDNLTAAARKRASDEERLARLPPA